MRVSQHLGIDHVDRRALCICVDLFEDIGKLKIELVLGHEPNMWCGQHIGMGGKDVGGVHHRLCVENIDSRVDAAARDLGLEHAGGDQARTRGVDQQ